MVIVKCVKCNSTENILPYHHVVKETKGTWGRYQYRTEISSGTVPACIDCINLFTKWNKIRIPLYLGFVILGFLTFWALLASFNYDLFGIGYWTGMNPYLLLIICVPIIIIMSILSYKYSRRMSPRTFIRFKAITKEIEVRPEGYKKWIPIKTWLEKGEP